MKRKNTSFAAMTDVITLVPNNAAVQRCLAQLAKQPDLQSDSFPAPALFTLSEWVFTVWQRSLWLRGKRTAQLAPAYLLQKQWESAMVSDTPELLPEERKIMASQAVTAERQLKSWVPRGQWASVEMVRGRFQVWRNRVNTELKQQNLMTREHILSDLARLVREQKVDAGLLPAGLKIEGFAELTTLERELLESLGSLGVSIEILKPEQGMSQSIELLECDSPEDELRQAAHWAAEQVELGKTSIAIVVNGLDSLVNRVSRVFEDEFHPELVLTGATPDVCQYQINNASVVGEHPLVQTAVLLLQLSLSGVRHPLKFDQVSQFLLSGNYEGCRRERSQRALIECHLRKNGIFQCSLARLSELATGFDTPLLLQRLTHLPEIITPDTRTVDLGGCLNSWGWPGPVGNERITRRVLSRFNALLENVRLANDLSASESLQLLSQLSMENRVSEGGGALSPVQVMSPHDAYGHEFDALALVNLHADVWPPAPAYQTLLSSKANRFIPRSSVRGQFDYAHEVTQALMGAAPLVRASWASSEGGAPQVKSFLLPDGRVEATGADQSSTLAMRCWPDNVRINGYKEHPWLVASWYTMTIPVSPSVNQLKGFASMLELQSGCPLAAYYCFRLAGVFEKPPEPFASPAFSGQLVHLGLEYLYRPALKQGGLPSVQHVPAAVEFALEKSFASNVLAPAALKVEQDRLSALLREWLDFEALQPAPDVAELEMPLTGQLAGFEYKVRIDRVDRLEDGSALILDYKTGTAPAFDWADNRMLGVQLPLYAWTMLSTGQGIPGGVGVAIVRSNEMKMKGIVNSDERVTKQMQRLSAASKWAGDFETFEEASRSWGYSLQALAEEFRQGHCEHIYHHKNALAYTGLEPLMRKEAAESWLLENDDER